MTVSPQASFTVVTMLLCGARLQAQAGLAPALARILRHAAEAAPAAVHLPDGRRVEPSVEDLAHLNRLAAMLEVNQDRAMIELERPPWMFVRATATASIPSSSSGDYAFIPSTGHYAALQQALALNTFESSEGSRFPRARLEKGGARGYAELRPITPEDEYLMAPEEAQALAQKMWLQREELSDLDVDVLDAISAAWLLQGPRSAADRVPVYIDDLLRARGLKAKRSGQGRRGGYEREQRGELWRCLLHLQDIWLDIAEATVVDQDPQGRRRQTSRALQSRAFVMTDRIGQRRLDGTMDVEAILITPGEAFGRFLLGPGRQLALLSSQALRYDPVREKLEKRLARYLSWQWRVGAAEGGFIRTYRITTLLEEIGCEINKGDPARTRDRLEKALDRLEKDRLISGWQYGEGWKENLPRKSWVPIWCEARVVIEAPDIIKNAYRQLDRFEESSSELAAPKEPPASKWGPQLKSRRRELAISQLVAAEQIGISRAYLAQIERGRYPSPAVQTKLRAWLK